MRNYLWQIRYSKIAEHLDETEDAVILPHINADGDALGLHWLWDQP